MTRARAHGHTYRQANAARQPSANYYWSTIGGTASVYFSRALGSFLQGGSDMLDLGVAGDFSVYAMVQNSNPSLEKRRNSGGHRETMSI